LGDVTQNAETVVEHLQSAANDGVDILVFPELFLTGYTIQEHDIQEIVEKAHHQLDDITAAATNVTAVLGMPYREDESVYNSAVVVENGSIRGVYHKSHLYDQEPFIFDAGNSLPVFNTAVGSLGIQICYDVEFPEVARKLTLSGADLLVTISANMRPFTRDQDVYRSARALENVRPHVLCNRVGHEGDIDFFGASSILNERGAPLVAAGEDTTTTITAEVDLRSTGAETLQYVDQRRPAIYDQV